MKSIFKNLSTTDLYTRQSSTDSIQYSKDDVYTSSLSCQQQTSHPNPPLHPDMAEKVIFNYV